MEQKIEVADKEHLIATDKTKRTAVLEKTLQSPLDFKEIKPVHPKGNQS